MDKLIQSVLYASRWILAPIYLGLIGALFAILIKFYIEAFHLIIHIFSTRESNLVLTVLGLIDLTLVGGLILMVMLSGYENFISKSGQNKQMKVGWLSQLDSNALKLKVAASIVAISSIHLLQIFMSADNYSNDKALTYIALHLTFVVSACLMAWMNGAGKSAKANHPAIPTNEQVKP